MKNQPHKAAFVCDFMLGKLARWLRIMGYDTLYWHVNQISFDDVIHQAKHENRILLTRSKQRIPYDKIIRIKSTNIKSQLTQLAQEHVISLKIDITKSRCAECNGTLKRTKKKEILSKLPPKTAEHFDTFFQCTKCGKIYWEGRHWIRIRRTLLEVEEKLHAHLENKMA